jgi:hypothetical protein
MPIAQYENEATSTLEELCKTIIGTAGIVLTLLWTLGDHNKPPPTAAVTATYALVASILFSLLALQFVITKRMNDEAQIARSKLVGGIFFLAWISFLVGSVALLFAILHSHA